MGYGPRLGIGVDLSQTQTITIQLKEMLRLLEMSNIELSAFLDQEIDQNPLLERKESEEISFLFDTRPQSEWSTVHWNGKNSTPFKTRPSQHSDDNDLQQLEQIIPQPRSLYTHLLHQINTALRTPQERKVALALLDHLDAAGYLNLDTNDLRSLSVQIDCTVEVLEEVLFKVQQFEPSGIFARSLKECLLLQLRDQNRLTQAKEVLLNNLPLVAKNDFKTLCTRCRVNESALLEMIRELRSLHPKPALVFEQTTPVTPLIPDLFVYFHLKKGWKVIPHPENVFLVEVDRNYVRSIQKGTRISEDRYYITQQLQRAKWLERSLKQRMGTILKISQEIVRQQADFLTYGVHSLRPLTLTDIAQLTGFHESTVSRVTSNKIIETPRGSFKLRFFFASPVYRRTNHNSETSESVRFRIKSLIDSETQENVLSDSQIVVLLKEQGIDISRRRVTKYRQEMSVLPSGRRRNERKLETSLKTTKS